MTKEEIIITTLNHLLRQVNDLKENLFFNKTVFNVRDFSAYSGLKESYIYKIIGNQEIKYFKPGGKLVYFKKSDIEEYLLRNPNISRIEIENKAIEFTTKKN